MVNELQNVKLIFVDGNDLCGKSCMKSHEISKLHIFVSE